MRIISDVDGVLANFIEAFLGLANEMFCVIATEADVTQWDVCKALKLDDAQEAAIYGRMLKPGYGRTIPPYAEALAVMPVALRRHEWYFATSPMRDKTLDRRHTVTWTSDREAWLHEHFGVPAKRVIHVSCKEVVRGDLLIEDSTVNIEKWLRADPFGTSVAWLVDRPWNREWESPPSLGGRVYSGNLTALAKYLVSGEATMSYA